MRLKGDSLARLPRFAYYLDQRGSNKFSAILPVKGRILQSLNLKNPKAYRLASELARLTGETLTTAVIASLEQRLEAERRKRGGRTAKNILAFADRFAAGMSPGSHSANHAELYDDDGMPR